MKRKLFNEKKTGQVRVERETKPQYTAVYKVNRSDELLEFLLKKCNTSRNNVKALLVRKQVLVNGSVVTQYNFPLAKDDEVKLSKTPVNGGATLRRETPRSPRVEMPKIIYEDDDFIAVDKPVGLLSVESDKEFESAYNSTYQSLVEMDMEEVKYFTENMLGSFRLCLDELAKI